VRSIRQSPFSRPVQKQGFHRQAKHLGDVAIAGVVLGFTSALMIAAALAVKLESTGPVFERQERVGRDGRRFEMLKFRTIMQNAEQVAPAWAQQTTQVGQLLRYTRIDTLPQLINVLLGEITLADLYADLLN